MKSLVIVENAAVSRADGVRWQMNTEVCGFKQQRVNSQIKADLHFHIYVTLLKQHNSQTSSRGTWLIMSELKVLYVQIV